MAASYPASVKSFTTRLAGDTIQPAHVNDLQEEVAALEAALVGGTGLAHDLKFVDATYDIGKSGATRPRDLFLSRNATIGGLLTVTGFGPHQFSATGNGDNILTVANGSAGAAARAVLLATSDAASGGVYVYGSGVVGSAGTTLLIGTGAAGIVISASHASGPLSLTTGGGISALSLSAAQAATFGGTVSIPAITNNTGLATGDWTPTLTNGANVAASTPHTGRYIRVGNTIMASCVVEIDATAAGDTATTIDFSLPVASDFAATDELNGILRSQVSALTFGLVTADITNNRATVTYASKTTVNAAFQIDIMYEVI